MYAIGNEELAIKPDLRKNIVCNMCGKRHRVLYGDRINADGTTSPSTLGYYKCKGHKYLAGVRGKDIR